MRHLCLAVVCSTLLLACEDILPVENVDLCEGDRPASADCTQCKANPIPAGCPQCRNGSPDPKCENADPQGGSSATSGSSGKGGSTSGTGGSTNAGHSGTGVVGGSSGSSGTGDSGSGSSGTTGAGEGGMSGSGESGAGDSGTGGTDIPVKCASPADCENPSPQCNAKGVCVACTNNAACADRTGTTRCDARVESPLRGTCVECLGNSQCKDTPDEPQCTSGECVACTDNGGCTAQSGKAFCDTNADSDTKGQCVECLVNSDCPGVDKPECNADHVCSPCTGDDACADRLGTTKCNLFPQAATIGQCVQCTLANEADACGTKACKLSSGTCSNKTRGSVGTCDPCEADSECDPTARCLYQTFDGNVLGPYCFFMDDDLHDCANTDNSRRPYSVSVAGTSIDGMSGSYCLPNKTCEAFKDATRGASCTTNDQCGEPGIGDGYCLAGGTCSYLCTHDYECLEDGLTVCSSLSGGFCKAP